MDIKKTIEKLQNIDIKDLKNIDYRGLLNTLKERPDMLIICVVLLIALLSSGFIYTNFKTKSAALKNQKIVKQELLEISKKYKVLQNDFKAFTDKFPKALDRYTLKEKINQFAYNRDIQIISSSDSSTSESDYANFFNIEITINADTYTQFIQFLEDIEASEFAIRINHITCSLNSSTNPSKSSRKRRRNQQVIDKTIENKKFITSKITISAIQIKK